MEVANQKTRGTGGVEHGKSFHALLQVNLKRRREIFAVINRYDWQSKKLKDGVEMRLYLLTCSISLLWHRVIDCDEHAPSWWCSLLQ